MNTVAANQTLPGDKALCSCTGRYGHSLCFSWWELPCPLTNALRHPAPPALWETCNVCLDTLATARPLPQALLGFPDSSQKPIPQSLKFVLLSWHGWGTGECSELRTPCSLCHHITSTGELCYSSLKLPSHSDLIVLSLQYYLSPRCCGVVHLPPALPLAAASKCTLHTEELLVRLCHVGNSPGKVN